MKIVADPNIPFVREAFAELGDITLVPGRQITAAHLRDAELLLIRSVTPVNAALLDGSRVQFVATATIGTDHVDEQFLARRGIGFASAAGCNANSVAEYIIAALLELAHRHKFRLRDKSLGVIGVGNVGSKVVRYARALGMRVLQNDPPLGLLEPATTADIVTVHVPLLETTRHMFHHDNLEGFILLNSSRGPVVDNRALLKAIDADRISAAVLDVWEGEPNISPELLDVVDLGTPHIAGYSFDGKVTGTRMIYEAACRHFALPATWQPSLPAAQPVVVDAAGDDEDVLRETIRQVYDITTDDSRLRANIREFDKQRADYPVRREFFNTTLTLRGASATLRAKLAAVGFRLGA
ncbi:MAG: Erythronate-4-phosphate dehydrogenase [Verrucomicrobiae bacterium]|nr:Erythronate-4-phosphate dehydrogenase [Verrucomicrobiae bacterium]